MALINTTTPFPNATELTDQAYLPFPFDNFVPVLVQCNFIVLAGYFVSKWNVLSSGEIRGITAFAGYFAMPSIVCLNLAVSDLRNLQWELLVGVVLGKLFLFFIVLGITLLLNKGRSLGLAAMYAFFCVHHNDLPVGNQLISAWFQDSRPDTIKYLFFMPALTLMFLSPISFFLMEVDKQKKIGLEANSTSQESDKDTSKSEDTCNSQEKLTRRPATNSGTRSIFRAHLLNLIKAPVILATLLGIALNLIFSRELPLAVHRPIKVLAATIPGLALTLLGMSMLGRMRHLVGCGTLVASVLVVIKMVFSPVILHTAVIWLGKAISNRDTAKQMSDFALLYGTLSPSNLIFVTAGQYSLPVNAISGALIVSSFICFPVSFVVAKISVLGVPAFSFYMTLIQRTLFCASIISCMCCVCVWLRFLYTRRWKKWPFNYVLCLTFAQMIMSVGTLAWCVTTAHPMLSRYLQVVLVTGGQMGTYVWTAILSVVLILLQRQFTALHGRFTYILLGGVVLPGVIDISLVMAIIVKKWQDPRESGYPEFLYGALELYVGTTILLVCLVVCSTCLVMYYRLAEERKRDEVRRMTYDIARRVSTFTVVERRLSTFTLGDRRLSTFTIGDRRLSSFTLGDRRASSTSLFMDGELTPSPRKSLSGEENFLSLPPPSFSPVKIIHEEDEENPVPKEEECKEKRHPTYSLFALLTFLWLTMAVNFIANIYRIVFDYEDGNSAYVPIDFLSAVLTCGQSIWCFLLFGIDLRHVVVSIIKSYRRFRHGSESIVLPPIEDLDLETQEVCAQFWNHHFQKCMSQIAKDRVWKNQRYKSAFWGHQLVQWLMKVGLAKDREAAEEYGQKLLAGRVIRHVRDAHHFYNAPYLYTFINCSGFDNPTLI